jgi:hypothetical protein
MSRHSLVASELETEVRRAGVLLGIRLSTRIWYHNNHYKHYHFVKLSHDTMVSVWEFALKFIEETNVIFINILVGSLGE